MSPSRRLAPVLAAALAGTAALVAPAAAHASTATPDWSATRSALLPTLLSDAIPSWAKTVKVVGATPADQVVYVNFALAAKDPAGEKAYGRAASTPGSPTYRHWLTKAQFEDRFGALPGSEAAVTTALKALGVTHLQTDAMGLSVTAAMPASLASTIFQVAFHQVSYQGVTLRMPTSAPTLPASLRPYISGISGLAQTHLHTDHTQMEAVSPEAVQAAQSADANLTNTAPTAYFNAGPTSTYYASKVATTLPTATKLAGDTSTTKPYVTSGYTPAQLRGAYGLDKISQTGKGVKVGIALFYDGSDVADDLAKFSTAFHLPAPDYSDCNIATELESTPVIGDIPVLDPLAAEGEQTLDAEAIHQMAPDASIEYCGAVAPEDPTIFVALIQLINDGVAVVNNSYGGTGDASADDAAEFQTLVTGPAMTMGVGLDFSTGDAADNVTANGVREVDFPASSDEVTGVGGTLLEVGKNNDYEGEAYWGTYSTGALGTAKSWGAFASQAGGAGGGGGVSTTYDEPDYQKGVVPASETTNSDTGTSDSLTSGPGVTTPGRVLPDVSMLADSTTGILVGETQQSDDPFPNLSPAYSYYRIGGTSVSSPLFTGLMADVDQAIGKSAGFVNPTIYPFASKHSDAFRDPTIGRAAGTSRKGSTLAQLEVGCSDDPTNGDASCPGSGPGSVPVVSEVRADYTDTANPGTGVGQYVADPVTGLLSVQTGFTDGGNTVIYHLRGQGVLGTLEDLPGYDDSTGLGSPYAPCFVAAFQNKACTLTGNANPVTTTTVPTTPTGGTTTGSGELAFTGSNPWVPVVAALAVMGGVGGVALRRRFR